MSTSNSTMTPSSEYSDPMSLTLEQQITELLTTYEIVVTQLEKREKALQARQEAIEQFLEHQLKKINALFSGFREIMTEAEMAHLQTSTQEAIKTGESQLHSLRKHNEETRLLIQESCSRFSYVTNTTCKQAQEAIANFKADEFRYFIEQSYDQVKETATQITTKIDKKLRWSHWKLIFSTLGFAAIIAAAISLYANDEWPWEIHQAVIKEREAGKALMNAWSHLRKEDQQYLENEASKIS